MDTVDEMTEMIYEMTEMIYGILGRTNLLALILDIEAVRDGAPRAGFKVVSNEAQSPAIRKGDDT